MSSPTYGSCEPLEVAAVAPSPKSPISLRSKAAAVGRRFLAVKTEVLSGMTTGIAQVPEAVGFSFAAGVPPVYGLYSSWIVGIVMSVLGARPAQIYGTAGSMVVVMSPLVNSHGIGHLFYAIMLSGMFQAAFGLLGLARLMKLIPSAAMSGFCNGLAVLIAKAQFNNFKVPAYSGHGHHGWVSGETAGIMAVYVIIVMAVMTVLPKYSKAVPSSLVGILVCMGVEHGIVRPAHSFTYLISDLADVSGDLPSFVWLTSAVEMPPLNGDTFAAVAPLAAILAVIAIVETLLTKRLLDTTLQDGKGSDARETIAQGFANFVSGACCGLGGCALIGTTMINVSSGGRSRLSVFCAGTTVLLTFIVAYKAMNLVPLAALAGVMFMIVIHTFAWHSLVTIADALCYALEPLHINTTRFQLWIAKYRPAYAGQKLSRANVIVDAVTIIAVSVVAVLEDLAIAIGVGIVWNSLAVTWIQSSSLRVSEGSPCDGPTVTIGKQSLGLRGSGLIRVDVDGIETNPQPLDAVNKTDKLLQRSPTADSDRLAEKQYMLSGTLFFANGHELVDMFSVATDPNDVELSLHKAAVLDADGWAAIEQLTQLYATAGKSVRLRFLQ